MIEQCFKMVKGAFTAVYSTFFFQRDLCLFYRRSNPLTSIKQTKITLKEKSTVNDCKRALRAVQTKYLIKFIGENKTRMIKQQFIVDVFKIFWNIFRAGLRPI